MDFSPPVRLVLNSQHVNFYVAFGAIVLALWLFQSSQSSKAKRIQVPFYKASILKWYFDAETLVRDSYCKVRKEHLGYFTAEIVC